MSVVKRLFDGDWERRVEIAEFLEKLGLCIVVTDRESYFGVLDIKK